MGVSSRIRELRNRLANFLSSRYIYVKDSDTMTTLIKKLSTIPKGTETINNIMPVASRLSYPYMNDTEDDRSCVYNGPSITGEPAKDGSGDITFYNIIPPSALEKAWPHAQCTFDFDVNVPGCRLVVDAEHSQMFNLSIWYKGDHDEKAKQAWLSNMIGFSGKRGEVDFPPDRTRCTANFGDTVVKQGHVNPPTAGMRINLLGLATGTNYNYYFEPKTEPGVDAYGHKIFGTTDAAETAASEHLIPSTEAINLNNTPYLYYSFNQDSSSGFHFALYCSYNWYLGLDGSISATATKPELYNKSSDYGQHKWTYGPQTGCINMLDVANAINAELAKDPNNTFSINPEKFSLYGLKFHGRKDDSADGKATKCTINYLFFGSKPSVESSKSWGVPATPTLAKLDHPAVGGKVHISRADYYAVGTGDPNKDKDKCATVTMRKAQFEKHST